VSTNAIAEAHTRHREERDNKSAWSYTVTDIRKLHAACPDLVELSVKRSDVLALIRSGTREIPGLRIFRETKVNIRA
jgi:hypothetical protein